jgi:hypothetical protein
MKLSTKYIGIIAILGILAVGTGVWFWYDQKNKMSESETVNQVAPEAEIPQWEKDALAERAKLGYPPLPEGWRLFRSGKYGFEAAYKEEWSKEGKPALLEHTYSEDDRKVAQFYFVEVRSYKSGDITMQDTVSSLPNIQQGSVSTENIRADLDSVRKALTDSKTGAVLQGALWLKEKEKRVGVLWNDVNGLDTFWASMLGGNKEYFFSGNALGQFNDVNKQDPFYNDFMTFLGQFRILN